MEEKKLKRRYGKSKKGNFRIKDTIGVPHPYCITPKHVEIASDEFSGMLGTPALERAEAKGVHCDICRKIEKKTGKPCLPLEEHKQALIVETPDVPFERIKKLPLEKELREYLLSIKGKAEKDNFAGFAFVRKKLKKVI